MKETVDKAQVAHIASLARLQLSEEEIVTMQHDLTAMLEMCRTMHPDGTAWHGAACNTAALRPDEEHRCTAWEMLQACAPCSVDGMIRIPGGLLEEDA